MTATATHDTEMVDHLIRHPSSCTVPGRGGVELHDELHVSLGGRTDEGDLPRFQYSEHPEIAPGAGAHLLRLRLDVPPPARSRRLGPVAVPSEGTHVTFAVHSVPEGRVYPPRDDPRYREDDRGRPVSRTGLLPPERIDPWARRLVEGAGIDPDTLDVSYVGSQDHTKRGPRLSVVKRVHRLSGTGTVSDAAALAAALARGVGRSRAHGLGLLVVAPL